MKESFWLPAAHASLVFLTYSSIKLMWGQFVCCSTTDTNMSDFLNQLFVVRRELPHQIKSGRLVGSVALRGYECWFTCACTPVHRRIIAAWLCWRRLLQWRISAYCSSVIGAVMLHGCLSNCCTMWVEKKKKRAGKDTSQPEEAPLKFSTRRIWLKHTTSVYSYLTG